MVYSTLATTRKVSNSSMINSHLSRFQCLLFSHIPVLVSVQTTLCKRTPTTATKHIAFDLKDRLPTIQKVQVYPLVVKPANETTHGQT